MTDEHTLARVRELLVRLSAQPETQIPTSALGRLRRTATAAARTGAGIALGSLRGNAGIDARVIEQLVL